MDDGKKDDLHDEISTDRTVQPGSVDADAPVDESLYEESQPNAGEGPKPGEVDSSGPTDTSHDGPE